MRMSFPSRREHRFHFSAGVGFDVMLKSILGDFGHYLETVVIKRAFLQDLINRYHFEASFQRGREGGGGGTAFKTSWLPRGRSQFQYIFSFGHCRGRGKWNRLSSKV